MIVISYRESREWNDSCNCHPEWQHAPSGLIIKELVTMEEVIDFLVETIDDSPDHNYWHCVFKNTEELVKRLPISEPQTDLSWQGIEIYEDYEGTQSLKRVVMERLAAIHEARVKEAARLAELRNKQAKAASKAEKLRLIEKLKKELSDE
jgi:hypothetical protein